MNFMANDSPCYGQEGKYVTSRQLRERLLREAERDVALRVEDTASSDTFKVSGRGILHLSILMENMRREGFEFMVGQPQVIYKEIGGKKAEPVEVLTVDVPDELRRAPSSSTPPPARARWSRWSSARGAPASSSTSRAAG